LVLLKKLTVKALLCGLIITSFFLTSAAAATGTDASGQEGVNLVVNGKALQPDIPAQIISDRTLVPVRFVVEALGLNVKYIDTTRTVVVRQGEMVVKLNIDGKAYKNEQEIILDSPAVIINSRALVPVRFISEAFGSTVSWDGASKTVTITKKPSPFAITSPNGGDIWTAGTTRDITWSYTGSECSSDVRISLYKSGEKQYVIVANVPAKAGVYKWTIPATQAYGNDYQIRISCNTNYDICDFSDVNFTISPIGVTFPNGGEGLQAGSTREIAWSYTGRGCSSDVRISLYKGGEKQYVIATNVPAKAGAYKWTIPSTQALGDDYKIRVSCNTNYDICDFSDVNFTISPIGVTLPNGGEGLLVGSTREINWSYTGTACSPDVRITLYKGSEKQYDIETKMPIKAGTYRWTVPVAQAAGDDYKIQISCNNNAFIYGNSANFSIGHFNVASPREGESWHTGNPVDINWNYAGAGCSSDIRISLYKGGEKQYVIAPNVPAKAGTYKWTIPSAQAAGDNYKIRISCNANYDICDFSDYFFTIE
jgi:hypothetical protein